MILTEKYKVYYYDVREGKVSMILTEQYKVQYYNVRESEVSMISERYGDGKKFTIMRFERVNFLCF
jgi:hypothetical protein